MLSGSHDMSAGAQPFIANPAAHTAIATAAVPTDAPKQPVPACVVEAKIVAAKPSAAIGPEEPVLRGTVVSAEVVSERHPSSLPSRNATAKATRAGLPDVSTQQTASFVGATGNGFDGRVSSASSSFSGSSTSEEASSTTPRHGKTELLFEFGRYVGDVSPLTGLREGQGCLHYKSGNVYTGQWRDGAAHGFGEKRYKNGDVYRGNWREGKRAGRGAYLFAQGHFYDGMYVNDEPEGYGIYSTVQGDRYAGHWMAGHRHGKGRETLSNGQVFVGNWRHGKKQGHGKLYLAGAEAYIYGVWNNDKFFRELTVEEMRKMGEEDIVDEFGIPRGPSDPPVPQPWTKAGARGSGVKDHLLMGVSALEDRMESFGKALERVMGTVGGSENVRVPNNVSGNTTAAADAASLLSSAAPREAGLLPGSQQKTETGSASNTLTFADGWVGPPAEGVIATDLCDDTFEDDDDEGLHAMVTMGLEYQPRSPPQAVSSAAAGELNASPSTAQDDAQHHHDPAQALPRDPKTPPLL